MSDNTNMYESNSKSQGGNDQNEQNNQAESGNHKANNNVNVAGNADQVIQGRDLRQGGAPRGDQDAPPQDQAAHQQPQRSAVTWKDLISVDAARALVREIPRSDLRDMLHEVGSADLAKTIKSLLEANGTKMLKQIQFAKHVQDCRDTGREQDIEWWSEMKQSERSKAPQGEILDTKRNRKPFPETGPGHNYLHHGNLGLPQDRHGQYGLATPQMAHMIMSTFHVLTTSKQVTSQ